MYLYPTSEASPSTRIVFPQPGLPLGFLLSLKESVGLRRAAGSPGGGWFPRLRQPVPPKQHFSCTKTPWFQKRKPSFSDTQQRSRRETQWKMIVRTFRIFLDLSKSSEIQKIKSHQDLWLAIWSKNGQGSVFLNCLFYFLGFSWFSDPIFLTFEPCKTESDFLVTRVSYTKDWV